MSTSPRTSAISRLVASDLVAAGLLRADDEASAARILDDRLATEPVTTQRPAATRLAAEVAGYLGGILVVAAASVFLASQWSRMDSWTRVLALLVAAADLGLASFAVRRTAPEAGSTSELARQARLLLAGTRRPRSRTAVCGSPTSSSPWSASRPSASTPAPSTGRTWAPASSR